MSACLRGCAYYITDDGSLQLLVSDYLSAGKMKNVVCDTTFFP